MASGNHCPAQDRMLGGFSQGDHRRPDTAKAATVAPFRAWRGSRPAVPASGDHPGRQPEVSRRGDVLPRVPPAPANQAPAGPDEGDSSERSAAAIACGELAERVGFEPTKPFQVYTLSKRAPSAARTPLQGCGVVAADTDTPARTRCLAEREGFEPPIPFRVYLISSQAPSTSSAISPQTLCVVTLLRRANPAAPGRRYAAVAQLPPPGPRPGPPGDGSTAGGQEDPPRSRPRLPSDPYSRRRPG